MPRTRLQPEVRRRQLLDAASVVFARDGFHASTVQDVADEAGVAKGLLHRYFQSKDDLIDALLVRRGEECAAGLRSNVEQATADHPGDTNAIIRAALEAWMNKLAEDLDAGRWVADPDHRRKAAPYYSRLSSAVVSLLAAARPDLDEDPARVLAASLVAATEAAAMLSTAGGGDVPSEVAARVAAAFCAGGLERATTDLT